jgi:hypothetical protein
VGIPLLISVFGNSCSLPSLPDSDEAPPSQTADSCPPRISEELPDGGGSSEATLVTAYRTSNKQITLCRTADGDLYYYGEFSDHREPGIGMPAEETEGGYSAENGPYRYEIHDQVVTIYKRGVQIGEETLTPEPSPS